jgi:hypothetical protein
MVANRVKSSQLKLLGSKCHIRGMYKKVLRRQQKKDIAAACLYFLNDLAFLRPAAHRAESALPWIVSQGRSYGFLWADSIIQKKCKEK